MDDIQFAFNVSDEIGRLYTVSKRYSVDMPIHSLTYLRGLASTFCDCLDNEFSSSERLESKIKSLESRGMLSATARRHLRTLQRNGNIAAHPESFSFEEQDFPKLVNEALKAALYLIEHLFTLRNASADIPVYEILKADSSGLKDMCYGAMIDATPEALHLAGSYFKEKARRIVGPEASGRSCDVSTSALFMDQAFFWFKLGAQKNHLDCMYQYGMYLTQVKSNEEDRLKGEHLIGEAAQQNHAAALTYIGTCYAFGSTEYKQSYQAAREYLEKAADQGHPAALAQLGAFFERGVFGEVNMEAAVECSLRAADAGYPQGQYNMFVFCFYGKGIARSRPTGLKWLMKAVRQDYPLAVFTLAKMTHKRQLPTNKPQDAEALYLKCLSFKEYHAEAALRLALLITQYENNVTGWVRSAAFIQAAYENIHTFGGSDELKSRCLSLASSVVGMLRTHIFEFGPERSLNGSDLVTSYFFDSKGVPCTDKVERLSQFNQLWSAYADRGINNTDKELGRFLQVIGIKKG